MLLTWSRQARHLQPMVQSGCIKCCCNCDGGLDDGSAILADLLVKQFASIWCSKQEQINPFLVFCRQHTRRSLIIVVLKQSSAHALCKPIVARKLLSGVTLASKDDGSSAQQS